MPSAWTRDQLLATLALYCQIPFGSAHSRNPDVIALSKVIGRTPGAISFKLGNFASFDPSLKARGIRGMTNASDLDEEIWNEFYGKWELLAEFAVVGVGAEEREKTPTGKSVGRRQKSTSTGKSIPREEMPRFEGPTETLRSVKQRRGQCFFRAAVLAAHEAKCCITGISHPALLRASHIVPWAGSADALRVDPRNGLCLNALHDAAFDRGLITLGAGCELMVSRRLKRDVPGAVYEEMFESRAGRVIELPARYRPLEEYLGHHRERVFNR